MSRFGNHLRAMKLARLHLNQSREDLAGGRYDRAGVNMVHAIELVMTSLNNYASLKDDKKPRRKSVRRSAPTKEAL